jgi:hypothetical protein
MIHFPEYVPNDVSIGFSDSRRLKTDSVQTETELKKNDNQIHVKFCCWLCVDNICFQGLLGLYFEDGQNFKLPKSLHLVQNWIFSSHRQLSKIVTP